MAALTLCWCWDNPSHLRWDDALAKEEGECGRMTGLPTGPGGIVFGSSVVRGLVPEPPPPPPPGASRCRPPTSRLALLQPVARRARWNGTKGVDQCVLMLCPLCGAFCCCCCVCCCNRAVWRAGRAPAQAPPDPTAAVNDRATARTCVSRLFLGWRTCLCAHSKVTRDAVAEAHNPKPNRHSRSVSNRHSAAAAAAKQQAAAAVDEPGKDLVAAAAADPRKGKAAERQLDRASAAAERAAAEASARKGGGDGGGGGGGSRTGRATRRGAMRGGGGGGERVAALERLLAASEQRRGQEVNELQSALSAQSAELAALWAWKVAGPGHVMDPAS